MRYIGGYTLVEVLVATGIIAILAATAVPYYQRYVGRADIDRCVTKQLLPARMVVDNLIQVNNGDASLITAANILASTDSCSGGIAVNGGTATGDINLVATTDVMTQGNILITLSRTGANGAWACTSSLVGTDIEIRDCP